MKKAIKVLMVSLAAATLLTACSHPPNDKVSEAKGLIEEVIAAGAEQFAPDKMQSINQRYNEAVAEIQSQESGLFGNYALAEFTLDQLMDDCDQLKTKIAQSKGESVVAVVSRLKPFAAE